MKTDSTFSFNNVLLPGTILLAHIDMASMVSYGLKAAIGGLVWLGIKILGEKLEQRRKTRQDGGGKDLSQKNKS